MQPFDNGTRPELFFPPRNGVSFTPVEHVNFTSETLRYATPPGRANQTAQELIKRMAPLADGMPFLLFEVCAGIGGNSVAFLASKEIGAVISYEEAQDRREMLKRNIRAYKLDKKAIVSTFYAPPEDKDQVKLMKTFQGAAFYFDPPWLKRGSDGTKAAKDDQIRKSEEMYVGEYNLDQHLEKLRPIAAVVMFHVPVDCQFGKVTGWKVEKVFSTNAKGAVKGWIYVFTNQDKKVLSAMATTNAGMKETETMERLSDLEEEVSVVEHPKIVVKEGLKRPVAGKVLKATGETPTPVKPGVKTPIKAPTPVKVSTETPTPVKPGAKPGAKKPAAGAPEESENLVRTLRDGFSIQSSLKSKPPKPSSKVVINSDEWVEEFRAYISWIIQQFESEKIASQVTEGDRINYFIQAWTHETFDPVDNYEQLEMVGDKLMGYCFQLFVLKREPTANASLLSEYTARYLSKEILPIIGNELGLDKWLLIDPASEISPTIYEDVVESFGGALSYAGDNLKPGLGALLTRRFVLKVFENLKLDPVVRYGTPKTVLTQHYCQKLHNIYGIHPIENPTEVIVSGPDEPVKLEIYLPNTILEHLNRDFQLKPKLQNPIGVGIAVSQKAAAATAYYNAIKLLMERKITIELIEKLNVEKYWTTFDPDLVKAVMAKAKKEGIKNLKLVSPRSSTTVGRFLIQLRGFQTDPETGEERLINLSTGTSSIERKEAEIRALEAYRTKKM